MGAERKVESRTPTDPFPLTRGFDGPDPSFRLPAHRHGAGSQTGDPFYEGRSLDQFVRL